MKKITVVGGGNAGCFTALYCAWMGKDKDFEVELIYDPEIPPERVGQVGTIRSSLINPARQSSKHYNLKMLLSHFDSRNQSPTHFESFYNYFRLIYPLVTFKMEYISYSNHLIDMHR